MGVSARAAGQEPKITTVVFVRHAEKADESDDASLSEAGRERAAELARVLAEAKVEQVYVSDRRRTRETADPLANARGLAPRLTPAAAKLGDALRGELAGQTVVVVGHSNTIPAFLEALGAGRVESVDHDDLFICSLAGGSARVVHLHYGRPIP